MKRKKVLIIFLVIFIIALSLLEFVQLIDYNNNVENYNNETLLRYVSNYTTIIYMYRMYAKTYYEEVVASNLEILNIIEQANYIDAKEKDALRERLIYMMNPTYVNAIENKFGQFQFNLVDSTSLLTMHSQEVPKDYQKYARESKLIVNEEQKYIEGFEQGGISNGYRFVYPLFNENRFIGSFEASITFSTIMKSLEELFGMEGFLVIKKTEIEEKVFDEFLYNYVDSGILKDYFYDYEIYDYFLENSDYCELTDNIDYKEEVVLLEKLGNDFIVNTEMDGQKYSIIHLAVEDVSGEKIAYLIFYEKSSLLNYYKKGLVMNSLFIVLLGIVIIIVYFLLSWAFKKIEILIGTDNLTKTYNRNKFYEIMHAEIQRKKRYGNNISIIMYDIDLFKNINDKYGHNCGDEVLKETTQLIKDNIRQTDYLIRWGGEEFIIILSQTKLLYAADVAEKLRKKIENFNFQLEGLKSVTVSLGVAEYNTDESIDNFVNRADKLLYEAKKAGRNQVKY